MKRVWDYIGFAVCFAGLGYVALRLVGGPGVMGLPPLLHAVGAVAAAFVPLRVALSVSGRRRAGAPAAPAAPRKPAAVLRPPRRKSTYPIRQVKPRDHFGLRGMPH